MKTSYRSLLCVALFGACSACAAAQKPAASPAVVPALPKREDLPIEAREVLTTQMLRHGDQMGALSVAVVLLDYEVVRLLAGRMADEPVLGRPIPGDDKSLNALLPKSFFVHQDELSASARALAEAATHNDDAKLLVAFHRVTSSCVGCHSAYLHEELTIELGLPCELTDECDDEPESSNDPDL